MGLIARLNALDSRFGVRRRADETWTDFYARRPLRRVMLMPNIVLIDELTKRVGDLEARIADLERHRAEQ